MNQNAKKRLPAKARRKRITEMLEKSSHPITGGELADHLSVSRQVIVQDIALLKARQLPIIATSQGYLFLAKPENAKASRMIACKHTISETASELNLIVDQGVSIINVTVEHPLYGEMTGSLMIRSRVDVTHFIERLSSSGAALLSSLTGGVHLHLLEADSSEEIDHAVEALKKAGFLL
ncbi:MAG: transcription repressor NadR [Sporolactobacillus sp.]